MKKSSNKSELSRSSFASKDEGRRALMVLADGTEFFGRAEGYIPDDDTPVIGELVFNTSMYGYQEIMTDPSYRGQIMCFRDIMPQ